MRFQENIYTQTDYQGVRNKDILNVNTSSDMCVFTHPEYTMTGAAKIDCAVLSATPVTISIVSGYTHIITTATTQDVTFTFTANTEEFVTNNSVFKYEIYKYDPTTATFHTPAQFISEEIAWSGFSGTSATTRTLELSGLSIDGDYLIKSYFVHDVCTDFANRLDYTNDTSIFKGGSAYGIYQGETDFYMGITTSASTPTFAPSDFNQTPIPTLKQRVIFPQEGQTLFTTVADIRGDFIVTFNGIVLARDLDYTVERITAGTQPYTFTLSSATLSTDILSIIFVSGDDENGLRSESTDVGVITSGVTNGEGSNSIYFNTTTGKYEGFLDLIPSNGDVILVMLNGVTLANGVDFYQSITNPKRIIFEGTILTGDIMLIVYNQNATVSGGIGLPLPIISWNIEVIPQAVNGTFILEFATDEAMTSQVSSASTEYEIGINSYSLTSAVSGTVGTDLYYRVTNTKDFVNLCSGTTRTIALSEVVPITITKNSINSY